MKAHFIAFAAALAVFAGEPAQAKKAPAPPPNIAASASVDLSLHTETLPNSVPLTDISVKYSFSHSFSLSAQQEAALLENTTVTVMGFIEVNPGEDPNFQDGDKSFKVTKPLPIDILNMEAPLKITAKWGNGKFTISAKLAFKGKDLQTPMLMQGISKAISGSENLNLTKSTIGTRAENILPIITVIEHPSFPTYGVTAYMAADAEMSMTGKQTATGVMSLTQTQKATSRFFGSMVELSN